MFVLPDHLLLPSYNFIEIRSQQQQWYEPLLDLDVEQDEEPDLPVKRKRSSIYF